jgi:hypothetical protein
MTSKTVRVPEHVYAEVSGAAHLLDCAPGELLQRAWLAYRASPEFTEDFTFAQKAFAVGDLDAIAARLEEQRQERARRRAARARELRST